MPRCAVTRVNKAGSRSPCQEGGARGHIPCVSSSLSWQRCQPRRPRLLLAGGCRFALTPTWGSSERPRICSAAPHQAGSGKAGPLPRKPKSAKPLGICLTAQELSLLVLTLNVRKFTGRGERKENPSGLASACPAPAKEWSQKEELSKGKRGKGEENQTRASHGAAGDHFLPEDGSAQGPWVRGQDASSHLLYCNWLPPVPLSRELAPKHLQIALLTIQCPAGLQHPPFFSFSTLYFFFLVHLKSEIDDEYGGENTIL